MKKIPQIFSSATDYTKSFVEPLLEETRAELLSNVKNISRASTRGIISVSETKYFKFPKDLFYDLFLEKKSGGENKKGYYEPEAGDLIAFTNRKPSCIGDLSPPNASAYVVAIVQRVKDEVPDKIQVLCSKPFAFPGKESKKGGEFMLFAVHLVNLTTNIRIWQALHSKLDGKNMKIIEKVLKGDSKVTIPFLHFSYFDFI